MFFNITEFLKDYNKSTGKDIRLSNFKDNNKKRFEQIEKLADEKIFIVEPNKSTLCNTLIAPYLAKYLNDREMETKILFEQNKTLEKYIVKEVKKTKWKFYTKLKEEIIIETEKLISAIDVAVDKIEEEDEITSVHKM